MPNLLSAWRHFWSDITWAPLNGLWNTHWLWFFLSLSWQIFSRPTRILFQNNLKYNFCLNCISLRFFLAVAQGLSGNVTASSTGMKNMFFERWASDLIIVKQRGSIVLVQRSQKHLCIHNCIKNVPVVHSSSYSVEHLSSYTVSHFCSYLASRM